MSDFVAFMAGRAKMIDQGHFWRTTRRAPSLDEILAAKKAQKREPSDPFVFHRAMTSMRVGLYMPSDFINAIGI